MHGPLVQSIFLSCLIFKSFFTTNDLIGILFFCYVKCDDVISIFFSRLEYLSPSARQLKRANAAENAVGFMLQRQVEQRAGAKNVRY